MSAPSSSRAASRAERIGGQQRRVAEQHQQIAVETRRAPASAASTAWPVPSWRSCTTVSAPHSLGERGDRLGTGRGDDDHALGAERAGDGEHMTEHRPAGDRVQHLGQRGFHPRALPGGKDRRRPRRDLVIALNHLRRTRVRTEGVTPSNAQA